MVTIVRTTPACSQRRLDVVTGVRTIAGAASLRNRLVSSNIFHERQSGKAFKGRKDIGAYKQHLVARGNAG